MALLSSHRAFLSAASLAALLVCAGATTAGAADRCRGERTTLHPNGLKPKGAMVPSRAKQAKDSAPVLGPYVKTGDSAHGRSPKIYRTKPTGAVSVRPHNRGFGRL